jgi:nitric oxide reductase subunit B
MANEDVGSIGLRFILLGLLALIASLMFGALASFKFLYPDFLEALPFYKIRPIHVSLAVSWIFLAAVGGIYYYLQEFSRLRLFSISAASWHFWIFLITGLAIVASYAAGKFGGREYWEFPPVLSLPIFLSWILFGVNYFKTVRQKRTAWPIYYWMWGTGIVFFFFTFAESYLWLFPYFRENMVREIMVQWKSFGSLVGSWNMLVYGTAIFIMEKISGEEGMSQSKLAFSLYFLGLFNLMFGWAHHAYPVPSAEWVRTAAYFVSMTELVLLGKIIWDWRRSLSTYRRYQHRHAFRFLIAADFWIFINLILGLIISVPAANLITHGTQVTVAHAMGTTIGINTMILLASVYFIVEEKFGLEWNSRLIVPVRAGFWLANGSLLVFFTSLVAAGLGRGTYAGDSFFEMTQSITPYLLVFAGSGLGLMVGLWLILLPGAYLFWLLIRPGRRDQSPLARRES